MVGVSCLAQATRLGQDRPSAGQGSVAGLLAQGVQNPGQGRRPLPRLANGPSGLYHRHPADAVCKAARMNALSKGAHVFPLQRSRQRRRRARPALPVGQRQRPPPPRGLNSSTFSGSYGAVESLLSGPCRHPYGMSVERILRGLNAAKNLAMSTDHPQICQHD